MWLPHSVRLFGDRLVQPKAAAIRRVELEVGHRRTLFFAKHPDLMRVCFNGQQAAKLFQRLVRASLPADLRCELVTLPSTSPAHASITYEEKRRAWAAALRN